MSRPAPSWWGTTPRRYLAQTSDTTVKAVTFEDSAALAGLVLAALGLSLEQITGDDVTVADVERASDEAERRLVARHGGVRFVFLDPTPGDGRARAEAREPE